MGSKLLKGNRREDGAQSCNRHLPEIAVQSPMISMRWPISLWQRQSTNAHMALRNPRMHGLQVLSGGHVPGRPQFLRNHRPSQGSEHRLSALFPPEAEASGNRSPRAIAEPVVAALAERAAGNLRDANVRLLVTSLADPAVSVKIDLKVESDLGLEAIDLLIGGESELKVRARARMAEAWITDDARFVNFGRPGSGSMDHEIDSRLSVAVDLGTGNGSVGNALAALAPLKRALGKSRALEIGDLNAAANADLGLPDEAEIIASLKSALSVLTNRIILISSRVEPQIVSAKQAVSAFDFALQAARTALSMNPGSPAAMQTTAQAEVARTNLVKSFEVLAIYGSPQALRPIGLNDALADDEAVIARLSVVIEGVRRRRDALVAVVPTTIPETQEGLQAAVTAASKALQGALDGAGLTILPPVHRMPRTTPVVDAVQSAKSHLASWTKRRARVAVVSEALGGLGDPKLFATKPEATRGADDDDPRPESEAPRSLHFGMFLSTAATLNGNAPFVGVVFDDWVEHRLSDSQTAAMALNYNAPKAQAPNAVLLCVPPNDDFKAWSPQRAAQMVGHTISWMQTRALTPDDKVLPFGAVPGSNRVANLKANNKRQRRIPWGVTLDTIDQGATCSIGMGFSFPPEDF